MEILRLNSQGPLVELLQSTLRELGFYNGAIDGIFGFQTFTAVQKFQKEFKLSIDGIVGNQTWNALLPYINGYFIHTIKDGDTFFKLANQYSTTVDAIQTANPDSDSNNLSIGETLVIPIGSIVQTDVSYTSDLLTMNLNSMQII